MTINAHEHSHSFGKKFPKSIPVLKIWMIGVDKTYQSQGLGKKLVATIFAKAIESAKNPGCVGIILDAAKNRISFYESLGFKPLANSKTDGSLPMIIKLDELIALKKQQ